MSDKDEEEGGVDPPSIDGADEDFGEHFGAGTLTPQYSRESVEKEVDITVPFIAIREDVKGTEYEPTMGEYLCNPLGEDLLDVEVSTGGFYSDESGVMTSDESRTPLLIIRAGQAVRFALSTTDEYAELVCHWTVRYRTFTNGLTKASFDTFKRLADTRLLSNLPVLGGPGRVVPRSRRQV